MIHQWINQWINGMICILFLSYLYLIWDDENQWMNHVNHVLSIPQSRRPVQSCR
jgi:hypothetical protein